VTTPTTAAGIWPARLCYAAAGIFSLASGGTNLVYGWQKGSDLPSSLAWAGVSAGVAIVFALSWPATIKSLEARHFSAACMSLVALMLAGSYSMAAALGSASAGRANAAATEAAITDERAKAQAAYDAARGELEALNTTKPATELQDLIEGTKAELSKVPSTRTVAELEALMKRGCPARSALNGQAKVACPKYDVELARAWERSRLTARVAELTKDAERAEQRHAERRDRAQAAMDKAAAELASMRPAKMANSDAKALARYITAVGLDVTPDRLNDLLVLLAVLMIEAGGGLSLAIGMALQTVPETLRLVEQKAGDGDKDIAGHSSSPNSTTTTAAQPESASMRVVASKPSRQRPDMSTARPPRRGRQSKATAEKRIVDAIRGRGGRLEGGSVRRLAKMVRGRRSTVHNAVAGLIAAGIVARVSGQLVLRG
jgi:hypothetical protein